MRKRQKALLNEWDQEEVPYMKKKIDPFKISSLS